MTLANLIEKYYDAFNRQDMKTFFSLMHENVIHDLNQGPRQVGKAQFREFMEQMNTCYREQVENLTVMIDPSGHRAAAEFEIVGTYLKSQPGLPEARGQSYRLPVGAFFEVSHGLITRISNYYNLQDWIRQVKV